MLAADYQVSVISPREKHHKARDTVDGVHVFRYPQPQQGDGFIGYVWEYGYSLIATIYLTFVASWRQGFDIIHCHNPPDLFIAASLPYKLLTSVCRRSPAAACRASVPMHSAQE